MTSDEDLHHRIDGLIAEEHRLRSSGDEAERARLATLEVALDQLWDLLRRRDAARRAGTDPDEVSSASAEQVEGYLQ